MLLWLPSQSLVARGQAQADDALPAPTLGLPLLLRMETGRLPGPEAGWPAGSSAQAGGFLRATAGLGVGCVIVASNAS